MTEEEQRIAIARATGGSEASVSARYRELTHPTTGKWYYALKHKPDSLQLELLDA